MKAEILIELAVDKINALTTLTASVREDGDIYINDERIRLSKLAARVANSSSELAIMSIASYIAYKVEINEVAN